jgi:hypothetical protein
MSVMIKPKYLVLFVSIPYFFCSCTDKTLKAKQLFEFINDEKNGLVIQKQTPNIHIKSRYEPIDYVIAKEKRSNDIKTEDYKNRKAELDGMHYFTIQLAEILRGSNLTDNEADKEAILNEKLYYFSYKMQNDFKLIEGGDTLPCKLYHFERMNDLNGMKTITLAFDRNGNKDNIDKTLILDSPILNSDPVKLNFEAKNILNTPQLKTYN